MRYVLISLLLTSFVGNLYFFSRPKDICEIQKDQILSKLNELDQENRDNEFAGKLLLLLLAELGLEDKIRFDSDTFKEKKCSQKVVEKVVEKVIPKEVIKTIVKKERILSPFAKRNASSFTNIIHKKIEPESIYAESHLSIFKEDRLNIIESGTYVIEHERDSSFYETLTIKNELIFKDKIWQGNFSSVLSRGEKKVISEFKTSGANSKLFISTDIRDTVTWKQKDYMILLWVSRKERLRFNGIIFKKHNNDSYQKYGNLVLQNY